MEGQASDPHDEKDNVYGNSKASKFQFKSTSERRSKRRHKNHDEEEHSSKRHRSERSRESRRHRESKRRHEHRTSNDNRPFARSGDYDDPDHRYRESIYDGLEGKERGSPSVDPDTAFRESLFDAMADDEGADYWEGVYGQPIHIYSNTKSGPDGKLERMNDDEYAEYVRTKMWEKSHQHILEERTARERIRQKRKQDHSRLEEDVGRDEAERDKVRRQMEESLRRGEERRKAKDAEAAWANYSSKWDHLKSGLPPSGQNAREIIPWPVASGKAIHVEKDGIEQFLKSSKSWRDDGPALLKVERVRWHPDKMQQRFGEHIDSDTMKLVTAVFQVVDRMFTDHARKRHQ